MVRAVVADEYVVGFRGVTDNVQVGGRPGKTAVSVVPDGNVEVSVVVGTDFDATERNGVSGDEGVVGEWDGEGYGVSLWLRVAACMKGRSVSSVSCEGSEPDSPSRGLVSRGRRGRRTGRR